MAFTTKNPYTNSTLQTYNTHTDEEVRNAIENAHQKFFKFKHKGPETRKAKMLKVAEILVENKLEYAKQITVEMGKPISQSIAEIEKCALVCRHYAQHAENYLNKNKIESDNATHYVIKEPLGVIFGIMPWNYPFWQVFRVLAPNIMLGNSIVVKHSPNTLGCAELISDIINKAGFAQHTFTHIIIDIEQVEAVIAHKRIKGVTFTGSTKAGSSVASLAGKYIKKSVLELGGSNALVILEDADLDLAVESCVNARFQNTGQSCIAGKRLLIQTTVYDQFLEKLMYKVKNIIIGNPEHQDTYISVLAREDLGENLKNQLEQSLKSDAKLLLGGTQKGTFFQPTIVESSNLKLPIFEEETFGPLLAVTSFQTKEEAVDIINNSKYGLGASIFTSNQNHFEDICTQIEDATVVMNAIVKSDPALPFGGTKQSGYGRELGKEGILEFANIKTISIQKT
jgi:succinate-semialdehyde dehydrogenase/glutarate-semialdehyde dehydrogenase